MQSFALFAFNGDPLCFVHVLLNALDFHEKGYNVRVVLEGTSVKLVPELENSTFWLHPLWSRARQADVIAGVCHACAQKLGTLEASKTAQLSLLADMSGHASMALFVQNGFTIITF